MRVLFIGTGDIGIAAFEALATSDEHDLVGLICQPDKPVGRKQILTPPRIRKIAETRTVPVLQPRSIKKPEALDWISDRAPDVVIVMAYGQILPKAVLDAPATACLNLHASILPKYRGAAPIQAAIRDGKSETGITVMYMDEGLDTGDILLTERISIATDETGATLHERLAELAPAPMLRALALLAGGDAPRTPQDNAEATVVGKLTRQDGVIDWSQPAAQIERLIRAYDPWPGTSTTLLDRKMKIFPPTEVVEGDPCPEAGTVLSSDKSGIVVSAGEGALLIKELQPEGKRRMSAEAFLAGRQSG